MDEFYFIFRIFCITFFQSICSTFISLLMGWIMARILWKHPFYQNIFCPLLNLYQVLPPITLILSLIICYGKEGLFNFVFLNKFPIYGLSGIVLCHSLLNIPFAFNQILSSYQKWPVHYNYLIKYFEIKNLKTRLFIEFSYLQPALRKTFPFIFCLCFTSLTVVLALGQGPINLSLSTLLYQSVLFSPDLNVFALSFGFQFVICAIVILFSIPKENIILFPSLTLRNPNSTKKKKLFGFYQIWLLIFFIYLILPFIALILKMFKTNIYHYFIFFNKEVMLNSLIISFGSSILSLFISYFILNVRKLKKSLYLVYIPLIIPSYIFAMILLILSPVTFQSLGSIIILQALFYLPFSCYFLLPLFEYTQKNKRLSYLLSLSTWQNFKYIHWSIGKRTFIQGFGLIACFSLGDINLLLILSGGHVNTLSLSIFDAINKYRFDEAVLISALLISVIFVILKLTYRRDYFLCQD